MHLDYESVTGVAYPETLQDRTWHPPFQQLNTVDIASIHLDEELSYSGTMGWS